MQDSSRRHLLALADLSVPTITELLDRAAGHLRRLEAGAPAAPALAGRTVATLFYEPSTRTSSSFAMAAQHLGARVLDLPVGRSSVEKGESLLDTARTLARIGADVLVMRHPASGAPHLVAAHAGLPMINAGDGTHEHPTQGLLDLLALQRRLGRLEGARVAIVGDVLHSRVARSDIHGLLKLGARVVCCGPPTLLPADLGLPVDLTTDLDEALAGADAVIVLRLQLERQAAGLIPSLAEYRRFWGVTRERLERRAPAAVVMHPGPANRGVEIDSEAHDGPWSAVADQVRCGVAVRMAVLEWALEGEPQWRA